MSAVTPQHPKAVRSTPHGGHFDVAGLRVEPYLRELRIDCYRQHLVTRSTRSSAPT